MIKSLVHLDKSLSDFGVRYVFVESGKAATESKCEELGLDKSEVENYWVELSWGSGDDEFNFAYNSFGDTLGIAIQECLNMFLNDLMRGEAEPCRAAKRNREFFHAYLV